MKVTKLHIRLHHNYLLLITLLFQHAPLFFILHMVVYVCFFNCMYISQEIIIRRRYFDNLVAKLTNNLLATQLRLVSLSHRTDTLISVLTDMRFCHFDLGTLNHPVILPPITVTSLPKVVCCSTYLNHTYICAFTQMSTNPISR